MASALCPGEYSAPTIETPVPGPKSKKLLAELSEIQVRDLILITCTRLYMINDDRELQDTTDY